MPEWDDEDDIDSSALVKDLRKQLKAAKDAKAELDKELSTLRPQVRTNSIKTVLSEIGADSRIAALLPTDIEPNKDAVTQWLADYGDLFNVKGKPVEVAADKAAEAQAVADTSGQKPETQSAAPGLTPEVMEMWARIQSGEAGAGATTPDIEKQQVAQLGQAVAASGGNFDSFVALLRGSATP